jgi:hypothetical protein
MKLSRKTVKAVIAALYSLIGYLEEHESNASLILVQSQLKLIGQRLEEGRAA